MNIILCKSVVGVTYLHFILHKWMLALELESHTSSCILKSSEVFFMSALLSNSSYMLVN